MRIAHIFSAVILVITSMAMAAVSSAAGDETSSNKWQYRVTPYAWVTAINGDRTLRGIDVETDASFVDLVEASDSLVALMAYSEARKGKLALYLDTVWAKLTASGGAVRGRNLGPLNITLSGKAKLEYQYAIVGAGVNYEVAEWANGYAGSTALDLMIGGRYWYQKTSLDLAVIGGSTLPQGFSQQGTLFRSGSLTAQWFDPVVGARMRHDIGGGRQFVLMADVGGFGVGSDFTWQGLAAYTFEFAKRGDTTFAGAIGYRALSVDYSKGSGAEKYSVDEIQHGPILGLSMRF